MSTIREYDGVVIPVGTLDFEANVYPSHNETGYRWVVVSTPDFPGSIDIHYEERDENNRYVRRQSVENFDAETWAKIKLAGDVVIRNSI